MDLEPSSEELEAARAQVERLESEIATTRPGPGWRATGYYTAYYATAGFMLGIFGAMASLLFNVIGAPIAGKNPLELIRVYLTFPLGEQALELTAGPGRLRRGRRRDPGHSAAACTWRPACCWGFPVYLALTRFAAKGGLIMRLIVASVVSLAIWAFNFYGILSWLQPLLIGGDPGTGSPTRLTFRGGSPRRPTWSSAGPSPCSIRWASTIPIIGSTNRPRDAARATTPGAGRRRAELDLLEHASGTE